MEAWARPSRHGAPARSRAPAATTVLAVEDDDAIGVPLAEGLELEGVTAVRVHTAPGGDEPLAKERGQLTA